MKKKTLLKTLAVTLILTGLLVVLAGSNKGFLWGYVFILQAGMFIVIAFAAIEDRVDK